MPARPSRRTLLALPIAAIALAGAHLPAPAADSDDVIVFAAASLRNALDDVVALYAATSGKTVLVSYAGTATLARQIEQAAPADIFVSADRDWMDYVEDRGLVRADTRHTLLGNRIVLVAPADSDVAIDLAPGLDLAGLLGPDGRLAMANTDAVPAGRYGKAALQALGAWDGIAARVVQADNVRAALAFVARGEALLGIVYATDAAAEPAVRVVGAFPDDSHPPILYLVAITAGSTNPDAATFLDFLRSAAARPAFAAQGFAIVEPGS